MNAVQRPRLSIVVLNRQRERFVAHAIESACAQTLEREQPGAVEVIVVDDGSRDGSRTVIRRLAPQLPLIALDDDSEAAAMNAGFAAARGELIVFLESEDWLHPEAAAEVLAAWRPGVSKVQFRLDLVDADDRPLGIFTDGDLRRTIEQGADLRSETLAQRMNPSPKTISPEALAAEAARRMEDARISQMLVVEDGRLVGALHMHDLMRAKVL